MALARWVLRASAAAFAGIGAAFLLAPVRMGSFVDLRIETATADNDVRAVYGGLQVAVAALLWTAASRQEWLRPGLVAQLVLFSGLAGARCVSWVWVGPPSGLGLALHAAEGLAIAAGAVCLHRLRA